MGGPFTVIVDDKKYHCPVGSSSEKYLKDLSKIRIDFSSKVRATEDKKDDATYVAAAKEFYKMRSDYIRTTGKLPENDKDLQNFSGIKPSEGKSLLEYYFNKNGLFGSNDQLANAEK